MEFYRDRDGDGWGDATFLAHSPEAIDGFVVQGGDCNDADAQIHPGAQDPANGIDEACDGPEEDVPPGEGPSAGAIVFNEFDVDQPGTDSTEFVELFNPSQAAVDLTNVQLARVSGTTWIVDVASGGTLLPSGGFFVVDGTRLGGPLPNGGATFQLLSSGVVLDQFEYAQGADPSTVPASFSRCPDGSGFFEVVDTPTPGAANACPQAPPPEDPCATPPAVGPNAAAVCDGGGGWIFACDPGFEQLDGNWENGCETEPTVSFASPASSVNEGPHGAVSMHSIPVVLSAPATQDVLVPFTVDDPSNPAFTVHGDGVTIPAGQTSADILFETIGNNEDGPDVTFLISLQVANPGPYPQHTVTILDDD